jgi:hypothetical protein
MSLAKTRNCLLHAIGYGETQGVSHKIKTVEQVSNASDITPSWFKKGVEAALLAPTAVNQQKFSFEHVGVKNNRHQIKSKEGIFHDWLYKDGFRHCKVPL